MSNNTQIFHFGLIYISFRFDYFKFAIHLVGNFMVQLYHLHHFRYYRIHATQTIKFYNANETNNNDDDYIAHQNHKCKHSEID